MADTYHEISIIFSDIRTRTMIRRLLFSLLRYSFICILILAAYAIGHAKGTFNHYNNILNDTRDVLKPMFFKYNIPLSALFFDSTDHIHLDSIRMEKALCRTFLLEVKESLSDDQMKYLLQNYNRDEYRDIVGESK